MNKINVWTAIVIVAGIFGMCFLAYFGVPTDLIMGYGAAFIALAGYVKGLFEKRDGEQ